MIYSQTKPPLGEKINFSHPLAKGLVACYLFSEGNGDKVYDLSGNGNTGTFTGIAFPSTATSGWNPCKFGKGLSFDGINDYVSVPDNDSLDFATDFTISFWFKTSVATANYVVPISKMYGVSPYPGWYIEMSNTYNYIAAYSDGNTKISYAKNLFDGIWHHCAVTKHVSGTSLRNLYIEGISVANDSQTAVTSVNSAVMNIGIYNFGPSYYFNGSIDEVLLYNRALSAQEVLQLYKSPFCMFGKMLPIKGAAAPSVSGYMRTGHYWGDL
jgi:hypothetical protein